MPAAAVIPAPLVYTKVVVVKKLVVECRVDLSAWVSIVDKKTPLQSILCCP